MTLTFIFSSAKCSINISTTSSSQNMAIDEIIAEIASLVYRTARGQVYEVCEIEWNEFMESEAPESKRGKMEWIDGEIVLVELGTTEYGIFVGTLASYFFLTTMMFARTCFHTAKVSF
ncbi:hypothetical protein Pcac1_g6238 [Phytophthora cactorum]|nr:hypothetical protein Pcac1_g6238 [Phytophthora cactorum]